MISLRQLRYFDAVARLGHFGKAASCCSVSQPALSMQIQELEKELGVTLVERRHKGAVLTDAGREIARRASRILAEIRDLNDFARQSNEPLSGALHLGIIPTIAPYLLPPLLPLLRERCPALDLHMRETHTETLLGELLDGTLDLLLLALPIDHSDVVTRPIAEDRFVLAMPREHTFEGRPAVTPELLKGERLLLLEEGHCLRDQALAVCHMRRIDNLDTFGASSLSTIVQMVANGMGLTLLPEISLGVETAHGRVRLLRFQPPEPRRTIGLAWRSTSPRTRDFEALGDMIAHTIADRRLMALPPLVEVAD